MQYPIGLGGDTGIFRAIPAGQPEILDRLALISLLLAASTNSRAFIGFSLVSSGAPAGTLVVDVAAALRAGAGASGPRASTLNKTRNMKRSRIASHAG